MSQEVTDMSPAERIRRLRAMARGWDRCAANAPEATYRMSSRADEYRRWAAACRDKADRLEDQR